MKMEGSRGSILIISLWVLVILVLLSIGLGYSLSLDQRLVSYQRDRLMAHYLAKAGYLAAVKEMERDTTPDVDVALDPLFHAPETFQKVMFGEGSYTVMAQVKDDSEPPKTFYGVIDEDRKINLNFASKEVLMRLSGVTEEMADSILDWRDEDPFSHFLGAEDFYYRGLEPPYQAKNAPFEVLGELLWVRGMTKEVFSAIEPYVTIYTDGKVNINTAPRAVLIALGMSEGLADKLLRFRKGLDGEDRSADDQSFASLGSAEPQLNAFDPLIPQEAAEFTNLIVQNLLKVKSEVFRITVQGRVKKVVRSVEAVVKRGVQKETGPAQPTILLSWYED